MDEVLYEAETEHQTDAARHQRISPEIKIQLQGISECPQPGQGCGNTLKSYLDDLIPQDPEPVRDQDFHAQAHGKEYDPVFDLGNRNRSLHIFRSSPYIGRSLRPPVRKAHDRTLRDLREHGEIGRRLYKCGPLVDLSAEEIRLIRDHFKNIEAQSQRQQRRPDCQSQHFKEYQHRHIEGRDDDQHLPVAGPSRPAGHDPDHFAEEIIDHYEGQQQEHKPFCSGSIENKAPREQQSITVSVWNETIYDHENGQKAEYKYQPGKIDHLKPRDVSFILSLQGCHGQAADSSGTPAPDIISLLFQLEFTLTDWKAPRAHG